jgi:methyl acetate hydrolase
MLPVQVRRVATWSAPVGIVAIFMLLTLRAATPSPSVIDQPLSEAVVRKDVPGVVAVATDRRGNIYQGAFGSADIETGRPMSPDALFRIASMTKAVTSVAFMQFVEKGRIALDDPAEKYLPELGTVRVFRSFNAATGDYTLRPPAQPITIRHLLTHTSGLGYGFTSATVRDFKPKAGDQFAAGPLLFDPGTDWMYGTSTDWVGRLVEKLSGQDLEAYFQAHILGPLGMTDTSYNVPAAKLPRVVGSSRRTGDRTFAAQSGQTPQVITRFSGGGGLYSTAEDYAKFVRMLLNGGEGNGVRILKKETVALMGENHSGRVTAHAVKAAQPDRSADFTFIAEGRDNWGLGFLRSVDRVPGKRSPGSLSWGGLNNTYFWIDPARGVGGVIMMQFLPFADAKALAVYDAFERGVYQMTGSTN